MAEDQNRTLQDKFMLRLPDGMREQLKEAAAANKRSMNAEIISRLWGSLEKGDPYKKLEDFRVEINEKLESYRSSIDELVAERERLEKQNVEMSDYVRTLHEVTNSQTMREFIEYIKKKEGIE